MKRLLFLFVICSTVSCQYHKVSVPVSSLVRDQTTEISEPNPSQTELNPTEVLESYANHSVIGRPGHNKIEMQIVKRGEFRTYHSDNLAVIRFYSRNASKKWELKQTLEIADDAIDEADPKFRDFNGDGLKDITFISGLAARGANEIRTLLIYDKISDKLVHIENSAEYPNIGYNKKLKCVDAFRVYGGTATDFAKIEGNRLHTFAMVENFDGYRTVTVYDRNGQEKVISRIKIPDDDLYTRYSNFRPVK